MDLSPFVVGCDISKGKIDFFDTARNKHTIITNDTDNLDRFLASYNDCDVRFAFEATGFYGNALRRALAHHGIAGVQINPLHGCRFAQSCGRLAKLDRIDAVQLAIMAERLDLAGTTVWDTDVEDLKALIVRRDQLVDMRAAERMRMRQTTNDCVRDSLVQIIDMLSQQIEAFDGLIQQTIDESDELRPRNELLRSILGIGPATASILIAMLPETGTTDRFSIASLAGVAPVARDSGTFSGKRSIAGGRPRVRRAFYQAALALIRGKSRFAGKYRQRHPENTKGVCVKTVASWYNATGPCRSRR